jgi:hypothetical protein
MTARLSPRQNGKLILLSKRFQILLFILLLSQPLLLDSFLKTIIPNHVHDSYSQPSSQHTGSNTKVRISVKDTSRVKVRVELKVKLNSSVLTSS